MFFCVFEDFKKPLLVYNSKLNGNDLSTPVPEWGFPGLKVGDKWCLCATRWRHAQENGYAPNVVLEATNEKTLSIISAETLIKFSHTNLEDFFITYCSFYFY